MFTVVLRALLSVCLVTGLIGQNQLQIVRYDRHTFNCTEIAIVIALSADICMESREYPMRQGKKALKYKILYKIYSRTVSRTIAVDYARHESDLRILHMSESLLI